MFEQSLLGRTRTRTKYSVCVSLLLESLVIGVAVLLPLVYTSPLPARQLMSYLVAPTAPPAARAVTPAKARETAPARLDTDKLVSPARIPRRIALIEDTETASPPTAIPGVPGGIPFGLPGSGYDKVISDLASAPRLASPPVAPAAEAPKAPPPRIRVSEGVQKAKQIYAPLPVYPELARKTRTTGMVRLSAIIGKDGAVQQLTLISGHPLLAPAAMTAVAKWRYSPTLLSGDPVEVLTQIDVNFTLNQ